MSGACVLRDYAVLADGERGALINPQGEISWMCFPRWHSDAVFSTVIGGDGRYAITPTDTFGWGGACLAPAGSARAGPRLVRANSRCLRRSGALRRGVRRPQAQLRGNLPQAFVHALFVECGVAISPEQNS